MSKSKNDIAWKKIFNEYDIIKKVDSDGPFTIKSSQINHFREARLMTKFDHKSQLPNLFSDNNLSILPISRGSYVIGNFDTFCKFEKDDIEITSIEFPMNIESLDYQDITSEATAINCAFLSNILLSFTEEESLSPTVSGRMSSSSFSFTINSKDESVTIKVDNSQLEIDGGYEGKNSLYLIEAKNYISEDFLVRQLYYPFKLWKEKIRKQVRPIYLTYTNGVFHLREYRFNDENHYNSLELIKQKKYAIKNSKFNKRTIQQLIKHAGKDKKLKIPFPQADSFERVINLCELLNQKHFLTKEEITQSYDFDKRQTDYYANAGKYLGLIGIQKDPFSGQIGCYLTEEGIRIFSTKIIDRQREFVKIILSHVAFKKTLISYMKQGEMPSKDEIVKIMKESKLYKVGSKTTYLRRASTIIGWTNWIINKMNSKANGK